nr:MAG TPA: putative zinc finger/helix-turn-helix protein, YgiT family [Caudoviricetes sp.]
MLTGAQIKEIRQKYRLSQQEFGSRLGVTHAHISKIESGKENPSETLLKLIQYEFNVKTEGIPSAKTTKPKIYLVDVEKIQKARLNMGLSQSDLAQQSGVSFLAVNRLEGKKTVNPRPQTIKRICDVLNLHVTDVCTF